MTDLWDVRVTLTAPADAGPVVRAGVLALLERPLLSGELDVDEVAIDDAGLSVTLLEVDAGERSVEQLQALARDAVAGVLASSAELDGWSCEVEVGIAQGHVVDDADEEFEESDEEDEEADEDVPVAHEVSEADLIEVVEHLLGDAEIDAEIDAEDEQEVEEPQDGLDPIDLDTDDLDDDDLGEDDLEDDDEAALAEDEKTVRAAAARFAACPLEELVPGAGADLPEAELAEALGLAEALAGCLVHAANVMVPNLFEDVHALLSSFDAQQGAEDENGEPVEPEYEIAGTWHLSALPERLVHRYTPGFAMDFTVAFIDLTSRLTAPWTPLSCVAQELGFQLLMDQVGAVAEDAGIELDEQWRLVLTERFLEDERVLDLYDPAKDGVENEPVAEGEPSLAFDDWFTPFDDRTLPPFVLSD